MQINNQSLNRWTQKLEVVITIIWLLCFLDVRLPAPIPGLVKALSYPVIAILIILRWKRFPYVATRDVPLLIYVGIAIASILWTVEQQRTLDGIRGLVRMFLFGAYFAMRYTIQEQMKLLAWVFGIAAIFSLVVCLINPSFGTFEGAWVGIFTYKNYMGYSMNIGAIILLLTALKVRSQNYFAWGGFSLCVALSILSRSAGSLINILMLLSLIPLYRLVKQNYKLRVVIFAVACILAGCITIIILGNVETILVDILGKSLEFNGRIPIWNLTIAKGLEKPFVGYGLNAFWKSDAGLYVMLHTWSGYREEGFNSHNSFIELFLGLGFLGIVIYVLSLITTFVKALILFLKTKQIEYFLFIQIIIFMCTAGWGDTNFLMSASSSYCCIYVSVALATSVEWERLKKQLSTKNCPSIKLKYQKVNGF